MQGLYRQFRARQYRVYRVAADSWASMPESNPSYIVYTRKIVVCNIVPTFIQFQTEEGVIVLVQYQSCNLCTDSTETCF